MIFYKDFDAHTRSKKESEHIPAVKAVCGLVVYVLNLYVSHVPCQHFT